MRILILNDTRSENHHGCSRVMNAIDRNLFTRGFHDIFYLKLMSRWDLDEEVKKAILQSDLVIVNGEGTLHGNLPHVNCLLNVISFAKHYGVNVAVINATLHNLNDECLSNLGKADYLYVRDMASKNLLHDNGIFAIYCPDLVFWNPSTSKDQVLRTGFALSDGYKSVKVIDNNGDAVFKLISINNLEQNFHKSSRLRKILIKLKQRLNFKSVIDQYTKTTHIDFLKLINTFECVYTGRYHIVCMCLLLELPFRFIESNTPKISYLLADVGLDTEKFRLSSGFDKTYFDANELTKIKKFNADAQVMISNMFDKILGRKSTK